MDTLERLIAGYLEGDLTPGEETELAALLRADPAARELFGDLYRQHRLLHLALSPETADAFTGAVLGTLRADKQEFVDSVMRGLASERAAAAPAAPGAWGRIGAALGRWNVTLAGVARSMLRPAAWIPATVCLVALLGLVAFLNLPGPSAHAYVWNAAPGAQVIRRGRALAAVSGVSLRVGDTVRTPAGGSLSLKCHGEETRIELEGATELACARPSPGKAFQLRQGTISVSAAPQPEGRPLVLETRQGRATVLGTRFILAARPYSTRLAVERGTVELTRSQDRRSVRVGPGCSAVAGRGVPLASLPQLPSFDPEAPQPLRVFLFSEYPEDEDWITRPDCIQQRGPTGFSHHLFKTVPADGSVEFEAVARVDGLGHVGVNEAGGWGFGLGLRFADSREEVALRTVQHGPQGSRLELSAANPARPSAAPCALLSAGSFHVKLQASREPAGGVRLRGKMWRQYELEPAGWTLEGSSPAAGALAAVSLSTFNCACTFTQLRLVLID